MNATETQYVVVATTARVDDAMIDRLIGRLGGASLAVGRDGLSIEVVTYADGTDRAAAFVRGACDSAGLHVETLTAGVLPAS